MNLLQALFWLFGGTRPANTSVCSTTTIIHHPADNNKSSCFEVANLGITKKQQNQPLVPSAIAGSGGISIAQYLNNSSEITQATDEQRQQITELKEEAEALLAESFQSKTEQ